MKWGDAWIWIAIDPVRKLIPAWHTADRTALAAYRFMRDLQPRLKHRVQLTTDGHVPYLIAVKAAFISTGIDYATLVKIYGEGGEGKYSPGAVTGATRKRVMGQPAYAKICTSHVERQNLTVRMSNRRFTRLTNGFSKSIDSHKHSVALHFGHYNFCRVHQSLRVTPAMESGITDRVWSLEDIARLTVGEPVPPFLPPRPLPACP
jgi:IS1 family transposase